MAGDEPQRVEYLEEKKSNRKRPEDRNYSIQELQARHYEIIRQSMLGFKNVEIASNLGISAVSVAQVLGSDLAQRHMAALQRERDNSAVDVFKSLEELSSNVVEIYEKVLRDKGSVSVQQERMAKDLLDRVGYPKTTAIQTTRGNDRLTMSTLMEIKANAREIIEGDYSVVDDIKVEIEE